ncbi:MAG: hypothetical protein HGB15_00315 [Chlorobaculum sp.]|nr:hypothetical protein [Chlorobaculum sp.]
MGFDRLDQEVFVEGTEFLDLYLTARIGAFPCGHVQSLAVLLLNLDFPLFNLRLSVPPDDNSVL